MAYEMAGEYWLTHEPHSCRWQEGWKLSHKKGEGIQELERFPVTDFSGVLPLVYAFFAQRGEHIFGMFKERDGGFAYQIFTERIVTVRGDDLPQE